MCWIPDNPSILIVGQEPAALILLDAMFRGNGFRTLLARSAPEAADIATRLYVPLHVVLADMEMMRTHGGELPSQLRTKRPGVPVLCFSSTIGDGVIRIQQITHAGTAGSAGAADAGLVAAARYAIAAAHSCRHG